MSRQQTIAILQHEKNEDAGFIFNWLEERNIRFEVLEVWSLQSLPSVELFSGVIVLGGESDVKDLQRFPWMQREIRWLTEATKRETPLLGICLGAQMLAHILGAKIRKLVKAEKGIYRLSIDPSSRFKPSNNVISFDVFQAHNYCFDIPEGATNIASSEICEHQLFYHEQKKVMGIQCHLEWSNETFNMLFPQAILKRKFVDHIQTSSLLFSLLDFHFEIVVDD